VTYQHGDYLRYRNDGCRCTPCTDANTLQTKRYKLRKARGVATGDLVAVKRHIAGLVEQGATKHAIATAAGVHFSVIYPIADEQPAYVSRDVADAILAVTFDDLPDTARINAGPTLALVDEITRHISKKELGRRLGWKAFAPVGRKRVLVATAKRVRAIHEDVTRPRCESCGAPPLAEGRWCLRCFQQHANPRTPRPTGCGTDAGYTAHRRRGTTPCQGCRDAHNAARERRAS
jgi:hypothetical protein